MKQVTFRNLLQDTGRVRQSVPRLNARDQVEGALGDNFLDTRNLSDIFDVTLNKFKLPA